VSVMVEEVEDTPCRKSGRIIAPREGRLLEACFFARVGQLF
jgi:hypothetical protein